MHITKIAQIMQLTATHATQINAMQLNTAHAKCQSVPTSQDVLVTIIIRVIIDGEQSLDICHYDHQNISDICYHYNHIH